MRCEHRTARRLGAICMLLSAVVLSVGCASGRPSAHVYENGVVAADHVLASEAGAEMLKLGGNAVDAAVATSFALSVVRPYSCGIGGGGFMVIHLPDDPTHGAVTTAINYRERAPGAVGAEFYADGSRSSTRGATAVGVPGTVAGLLYALDRYGTLDRSVVLRPAIRAASEGFRADAHYVDGARSVIAQFEAHPEYQSRFPMVWRVFLHEGNVVEGALIRNPDQAVALRLISLYGADAFYDGQLTGAIIGAIERDGGVLTREDLRSYEVSEVEPLRFRFFDYELLGMPPPSSGGVAMGEALGLLERVLVREREEIEYEREYALEVSRLAECFKHAFADRARWLGDPEHGVVPVDWLLADERLDALAADIRAGQTQPIDAYGSVAPPPDDAGTSHLCATDQWGGAVSCTETINLTFGSLVGVDAYGFVLNNEMDDFTARPGEPNAFGLMQSALNAPAPGKRPLSSMSPTIVLDDEGVFALAGASGGPRIITSTLQVLYLLMGAGGELPARLAVERPRVHHQWLPDVLYMESSHWDPAIRDLMEARGFEPLRRMGYEIEAIDAIGNVQTIMRDGDGWQAASDPRKGGLPAGH